MSFEEIMQDLLILETKVLRHEQETGDTSSAYFRLRLRETALEAERLADRQAEQD